MIYWLGVPLPWRSQPAPPPPTAIPTGLAAISAPANQVSILLLVVDDRTSPQPWLEGCWLLTFKPGTNQYYLLGFPVDAPFSQQYTLRDYFNANSRVEDRSRFVENALNHASSGGITVNYTLYLDEAVLADFVDFLGGLALQPGEPALTGAEMRAQYHALAAAPQRQMDFQRQTLEAMTAAVQRQAPDEEALQRLAERFASLTPYADELLRLAIAAGPLEQATFNFKIAELPR